MPDGWLNEILAPLMHLKIGVSQVSKGSQELAPTQLDMSSGLRHLLCQYTVV